MNEAAARIKINTLLETAGWRFFSTSDQLANICLEAKVALHTNDLERLGNNFENTKRGFIDFLLLDTKGKPLAVLEAKAEHMDPLSAKEQARDYAHASKCRFILLSNGKQHYFWDLHSGNPTPITAFPTPISLTNYKKTTPQPQKLVEAIVADDYIILTQNPKYKQTGAIDTHKLRPLRPYQLNAVHSIQNAVKNGHQRFLFEMATGTGKTLIAAAVSKLFLHTSNAHRVLFLVDRLELETQAAKAFTELLKNDFTTVIYKDTRTNWQRADIVVTTIQSLLFNDKYLKFTPTDFNLIISDESHRSIGGEARQVFEYFVGYKLGLTATPRDYLRGINSTAIAANDPGDLERRLLLDTYRIFGCENSAPTFRYSLLDGVNDGFLISPTTIDARTDITTTLLSEQGFTDNFTDDSGADQQAVFKQRDFEKRFFSTSTNQLFCETFLQQALRDPISGEIGKSIIFAVSQHHATKLTQILNQLAASIFPGKYQSDFAIQVTSEIPQAQKFTSDFANNMLRGKSNFRPEYDTSKTRVCVTVGMMTTGYDCADILNLGLMRPIFSPTDFIQIKGRGTRRHNFLENFKDKSQHAAISQPHKTTFKLIDFFANCEYFEEKFNYDQVLQLPRVAAKTLQDQNGEDTKNVAYTGMYQHLGTDSVTEIRKTVIGYEGMKIDRMFFTRFESVIKQNEIVTQAIKNGEWERAVEYVIREIFNKPTEYYTLEKLRASLAIDRQISLREILEQVFGVIAGFKSKKALLEEEFSKFLAKVKAEETAALVAIKNYFIAYITSKEIQGIIDNKDIIELATNPAFSLHDYKAVPPSYRTMIPEYIKTHVALDQF